MARTTATAFAIAWPRSVGSSGRRCSAAASTSCRRARRRGRTTTSSAFPEGPAGAHLVENRSRILILSSKSPLVVVHYPDSGKVGIWSTGEGYRAMLRDQPNLDYWEGEA